MTRLLIHQASFERAREALEARGPALEFLLVDDKGDLSLAGASVAPADAAPDIAWANVFGRAAARAFMSIVLDAPDIKWVHTAAAGFDHPVFAAIVAKGARLTTSHGQAVGMADYVLAGVLDHFQGGPGRRAAQARGEWARLPFRELAGSTWLVVGFGAIGQGVATRAKSFGARTIGIRRNARAHPAADIVAPPASLADHLPAADVVVLCAPLNARTRHIANPAFFAAMKTGSVLVNVARGGLVDEAALLAALERDAPAHAVLDVFETEPLPPTSPFWTHPKVSVTAHASGNSAGEQARNQALFLEDLGRYLAGAPLLNEVDPADVLSSRTN